MFQPQAPQILVLSSGTKRESGRKVQLNNVRAAKAVADVIRTCLGPRAMLKMLMNPMGSIVMTNDGNAILREITVQHPAAKSMIEISRTQDEEVGDGTTSVIILAAELMSLSQPFLEQSMHPTIIISAYRRALDDILEAIRGLSKKIDPSSDAEMIKIIQSCLCTKMMGKWGDLACSLALKAVRTVLVDDNGRKEVDIKKYAKVEKVPGGLLEESRIIDGIMLNKDVVHSKMRRYIKNPRVLLLDSNLEYKKGESQTEIEVLKEADFNRLLQIEEEAVGAMCADIIRFKPDLIACEKGVSDLAQHYLQKAGISVIRRLKKTDNNRIARATGATIVNRTDEIREEDIGTKCGRFEVKKIGDEYFCFIDECKDPKACTILLRGPSKDILAEVERNLQDALCVARNMILEPYVVAGGGAIEMAIGKVLNEKSKSITGVHQWPYKVVSRALEVIPKTLIQNGGRNSIRTLTALRAKHAAAEASTTFGINGETGDIADMNDLGIWDPMAVKLQVYKTAVETAVLLLRIDDIVSGSKKREKADEDAKKAAEAGPTEESMKEE